MDTDTGDSPTNGSDEIGSERPRRVASRLTTIGARITSRSVLLATVPLVVLGVIAVASFFVLSSRADRRLEQGRELLVSESIGSDLAESSLFLLDRMDDVVTERIDDVIDWSRSAAVVEAAGADRPEIDRLRSQSVDDVEAQFQGTDLLDSTGRSSTYLSNQIADRTEFAEVFFTDSSGFNVGATNPTSDFVQRDEGWWQTAWNERAFLGPIELDQSAGVVSLEVAVRIDDPNTLEPLGVMKAVVDVSLLQSFADEFSSDEAQDLEVSVVAPGGGLVAETASNHSAERIAQPDAVLAPDDEAGFGTATSGASQSGFLVREESIVGYAQAGQTRFVERLRVDISNHEWVVLISQPATTALRPLRGLEAVQTDLANSARTLTLLVVVLIAVSIAIANAVSRVVAQRITDPINQLRDEAHRISEQELPSLVESLQDPESVQQAPEVAPVDVDADGEVADLAEAFNSVQSTAVRLAADQAIARRQVTNMLRNLGRRNQQLIGRQLEFIDRLEEHESDPDVLENLFRLDSLATRMRRNAESLVVLAGDSGLRSGGEPMPIEDVIRGAISEVEDYERVQITAAEPVMVQGNLVNDLTHLLAEIIENATNFSPPGTPVAVIGSRGLDDSYSISVVDQGLGMSRRKMAEANARIRRPNITDDGQSSFLGLYVIGRLAARHNIDARLVESATEGVTAKLTLPASCIADLGVAATAPAAAAADAAGAEGGGLTPRVRHRTGGQADPFPAEVPVPAGSGAWRVRGAVSDAAESGVVLPEPEPEVTPSVTAQSLAQRVRAARDSSGDPATAQQNQESQGIPGEPASAHAVPDAGSDELEHAMSQTTPRRNGQADVGDGRSANPSSMGAPPAGVDGPASVDPLGNGQERAVEIPRAHEQPPPAPTDSPTMPAASTSAARPAEAGSEVDNNSGGEGSTTEVSGSDPLPSEEVDLRDPAPAAVSPPEGTMQVRQRTSRRRVTRQEEATPKPTVGGRARAEQVRERLSRFNEGATIGRVSAASDTSDDTRERAATVAGRLTAFVGGSERGRAESAASDADPTPPGDGDSPSPVDANQPPGTTSEQGE